MHRAMGFSRPSRHTTWLLIIIGLATSLSGKATKKKGARKASQAVMGPLDSTPIPSTPLPGMPPVLNPSDIYSEDAVGKMSPVIAKALPRVYVPNTVSNTVDVIDQATFKVVD